MGDQTDHAAQAPQPPRQRRRRAAKAKAPPIESTEPQPAQAKAKAKAPRGATYDEMREDEYAFPLTGGGQGVAEAAARIQTIRDGWNTRSLSGYRRFPNDPTEHARVRTKRRCVMRVVASDGEILTFPHAPGLEGELLHVLRFDASVGVWWRCKLHVEAGPDVLLCRAEAMEVTHPGNGRDVSVEIPGRAEDYSLLESEESQSAP